MSNDNKQGTPDTTCTNQLENFIIEFFNCSLEKAQNFLGRFEYIEMVEYGKRVISNNSNIFVGTKFSEDSITDGLAVRLAIYIVVVLITTTGIIFLKPFLKELRPDIYTEFHTEYNKLEESERKSPEILSKVQEHNSWCQKEIEDYEPKICPRCNKIMWYDTYSKK